jgi:carboxyl-terminal processing protease
MASVGKLLGGEAGSSVSLAVRGSGRIPKEVLLIRGSSEQRLVERYEVARIPIVVLRNFATRETRTLLSVAFSGLMVDKRGLVIDLRDSPGGDLFEALDAAGLFVPTGEALGSTHDRKGGARKYVSPAGDKYAPALLDIWVGPGTASAAEVFAGILQKRGIARLVGQRTRGKCSSQVELTLSDRSVLRLTNREVRFVDGTTCSEVGLVPDVVVDREEIIDTAGLLQFFQARRDGQGYTRRTKTPPRGT